MAFAGREWTDNDGDDDLAPPPAKRSKTTTTTTANSRSRGDSRAGPGKQLAVAASRTVPPQLESTEIGGTFVYPAAASSRSQPQSQSPSHRSQAQPRPSQLADDDEPETVDLTQDNSDADRELYGKLDNKIVGVRYYGGYAALGERVLIRREPRNQYDSNAIRVDNVLGVQIGHIPRKVAEKLAPFMDEGVVSVEGTLSGEKGFYDCPIVLSLFGTGERSARAALEERLKAAKLLKAMQLKRTRQETDTVRRALGLRNGSGSVGVGVGHAAGDAGMTIRDLALGSQVVDFRQGGDAIKTLALDDSVLEAMPRAEQPVALRSQLLPYQLQGLAWMRAKEDPQLPAPRSSDVVQLWKRDTKDRFVNLASNFVSAKAPALLSGGILADDMGLGKTLQVISLILAGGAGGSGSGAAGGPTLVIAPVTVMSNWEQQIRRHVRAEMMPRVAVYHGKKMTAAEMRAHDVVVTSYGKVSSENKLEPNQQALLAVSWRRVVLDEGHTIRNAKTAVAVACCRLKARSRWVLSGTPIINNIKDLHALLRFLRISGGLEQAEIFNGVITRPLALGDATAEAVLQRLMRDLCLRRRKDMKFVDLRLPAKTEYVHHITFRPDEKAKYDALLAEAKGVLEEYRARSTAGQKGRFQSVLERLLRLRQTCNHWMLCKERIDDLLKLLEDEDVVPLNNKNRAILQQALQLVIDSQEECPVCYEPLGSPVITHCKHVFCRPCISKAIQMQAKCPMCRNKLTEDALVEPAPETGCGDNDDAADFDAEAKSSKTEALLQILKATLRDPQSKVVVFSQWTSFLDIVQRQVAEAGIGFTRVDGSMRADRRDAAIDALDHDPATRVVLASLGVCSVGLNLVAADTVVLTDSWWAPAIEDQAVDRVHRLGQTRPTTVWRLIMEGTVEERVLDVQAEKRDLVNKAFREKTAPGKKSQETRMADLMKLLA